MRAQEFFRALTSSASVAFEDSQVSAGHGSFATALVDHLRPWVDDAQDVHFGVALSSFSERLSGQLWWLLILDRGVLEVTATFDQHLARLTTSVTLHAVSDIVGVQEVLTFTEKVGSHPKAIEAVAHLKLQTTAFELRSRGDLPPSGVRRFVRAISSLSTS